MSSAAIAEGKPVSEAADIRVCIYVLFPAAARDAVASPRLLGGVLVRSLRQLAAKFAGAKLAAQGAHVAGYDARTHSIVHLPPAWEDSAGGGVARAAEQLSAFMRRFAMEARPPHRGTANTLVFANAAYLLRDSPKLESLMVKACRVGVACAGASDGSLHAVAVSLHGNELHGDGLAALLSRLSGRLGRRTSTAESYPQSGWELVDDSGPGVSPAMEGVQDRRTPPPFDAPMVLNVALSEAILQPAQLEPIDDDAERLRTALLAQRGTSAVRWIFNELLNVVEHRGAHTQPDSVPPEIHIALSGTCNIECSFCSYSHDTARRDQVSVAQMMQLDFLRDVRTLRLHSGNGESTVNRSLAGIVRYVGKAYPQVSMNFFTNGILLDRPGLIPALVASPVGWISVSLNAASPESWTRLCGTNQFERITRNLSLIQAEKRARRSNTPVVYGSMVLTKDTVHELPLMPEICRRFGVDRFTAIPFFSLGYHRDDRLGPADAYHLVCDAYDGIYASTVAAARRWKVSIELPAPSARKGAAFGLESRDFLDFANANPQDSRLDGLLASVPTGNAAKACHFLWRQAAVGISGKAQGVPDNGHYLYPCLGPLATVDIAPHTSFRFPDEAGFRTLWRNALFTSLRLGQRNPGQVPVCDTCRGCDTRAPESVRPMQAMLDEFVKVHGLERTAPVTFAQRG